MSPTQTRFDNPKHVEVWEYAPNDECDRWTVYIGNDCYVMSDNANMPNGVCMYAGTSGDCFRPRMEGRPTPLCELPTGVLLAILREVTE